MRTINNIGLELIKVFEGCKLISYKDPIGIWTIGVGHTGPDIKEGLVITDKEANEFLQKDLQVSCSGVTRILDSKGLSISDNQFSALVSLAYNIGVGRLSTATLIKDLEEDELIKAADGFLKFVYAKGVKLPGLVRRRTAERSLFLS